MNKLLEQINKTSKFKLGEISDVRRGASPRPIHNFISKAGMPWVKIADVTSIESRFIYQTKECIKEEGVKNSVIVNPGDLILSNSATPGIPKFLGITACIHDGWLLIKPNEKVIDKNYLYYKLLTTRKILRNSVSGAIFDNLKTDIIKDFQIDLPDLPIQKKIASILGAYDEKIENNNKIIKNLEETAQTIFNEWFVNFKFPGYEKVKMVDSETGEIPEGWKIGKISDFGNVVCGKTPSKSQPEYFNGEFPFIKIPDMHGQMFILDTEDSLTQKGVDTQKNKIIPEGSICVSCIATVGLVSITTKNSQTNQQINTIVPKNKKFMEYLYFTLTNIKADLQAIGSGGSTTLNVNTSVFSNIEIVIPEENILGEFHSMVVPMFNRVKQIVDENISLKSQRDLLLAKLI